jgi:hypothetical protein
VMGVTDRLPLFCQAVQVLTGWPIRRKLFAAIVMLSFSVGPALPARTSDSGPQPASKGSAHASQPPHPTQDHSCCPRVHTALAPPIALEVPPESVPCRERPCCMSQGTDAPAGLPTASGERGSDIRQTFREKTDPEFQLSIAHDSSSTALQLHSSSSMVLRI